MGAEVLLPLILTGVSAGMSAYNTNQTAKREDRALADSIRNQASKQREADAKTLAEVSKTEASSSRDEEAKRTGDYMTQLRRNRASLQGGLTPSIGGSTFTADAAQAGQAVDQYAGDTAGLMAQVDAPGMQRQGEGFSFGKLATDIGLLQRESRGQAYIDELRRRSVRRNPWLDMAAGLAGAAGGAMAGGGGGLLGGLLGGGSKVGATTLAGSPAPAYGGYPIA